MNKYPKPSAKLAKAFETFQAEARKANKKPMQEADKTKGIQSRLTLFAVLEALTEMPKQLVAEHLWLEENDKTKASDRFKTANKAQEAKAGWSVRVLVDDFCTFRSTDPRKANTLGEAVKSYYSLPMNDKKHFITIPDRNDSDYAIVVRVA